MESGRIRNSAPLRTMGVIEYAYHLMALRAGITMAPCRLF